MKNEKLAEKLEKVRYQDVLCVGVKDNYWIGILRYSASVIVRGTYTLEHKMGGKPKKDLGKMKASMIYPLEEPLQSGKHLIGRRILCKIVDLSDDLIVKVEGVAFYGLEKEPLEKVQEADEKQLSQMRCDFGIRKEIWQAFLKAFPIKIHNTPGRCFIETPSGNWMIDTEKRKLFHGNEGGKNERKYRNAKGLEVGYHEQWIDDKSWEAMLTYIIRHDFYYKKIKHVHSSIDNFTSKTLIGRRYV